MNRNTSISLGEHFTEFVDAQVQKGKYATASEVVRAGLRLLEEHEDYIAAVRAALIEGEESGEPEPFDVREFIAQMHSEHE
jgi:antitoxin ParD1/3/4